MSLMSQNKSMIYGAGYLGLWLCDSFLDNDIIPAGIIDRDSSKWGVLWREKVQIVSPDILDTLERDYRIIIAHSDICVCGEIKIFLEKKTNGFHRVESILEFAQHDEFACLFEKQRMILKIHKDEVAANKEKIDKVNTILEDDISLNTYRQIICALEHGRFNGIDALPITEQYFLNVFTQIDNEVFVDVGAGPAGDVLQTFLQKNQNYSKYYYFEPDENIKVIKRKYQNDSRISFCNVAVSDVNGKVCVRNYMNMNSIVNEGVQGWVDSIRLDDFDFCEFPTFLKIDVEGYELRALGGAERLIKSCRPIIACAIYHSEEDFWDIPLYLYNRLQNYHFYVRSYLNLAEVILYAVPEERWSGNFEVHI